MHNLRLRRIVSYEAAAAAVRVSEAPLGTSVGLHRMKKVPVFISYHGTDILIARELKSSLERLSADFEVFLDRDSIAPSAEFEEEIASQIKRSEWFLIVCTGFPRADADMMWSFFEAGQFRATLTGNLVKEVNKRIVCVFDREPPAILEKFQGVKVVGEQLSGALIDTTTIAAKDNIQFDDSSIFNLFVRMLGNAPNAPLRDTKDRIVREIMREESLKLIKLFAAAGIGAKVDERSLQPRISFDLLPNEMLTAETPVRGYDGSLQSLFGIDSEMTTWGQLISMSNGGRTGKPLWVSDVEDASTAIMRKTIPDSLSNKCVLRNAVYRVYVSRYEVFKNEKRSIFVVFLPATNRNFDLSRSTSTLLSSLILSVRFREQLIPMARQLAGRDIAALSEAAHTFYRTLSAIEIEALQFGLTISDAVPGDDAPLTMVFSDKEKKAVIRNSIDTWSQDRKEIERMFIEVPFDSVSRADVRRCSDSLRAILKRVEPRNREFIELISEELMSHVKNRAERVPRKDVSKTRSAKTNIGRNVTKAKRTAKARAARPTKKSIRKR